MNLAEISDLEKSYKVGDMNLPVPKGIDLDIDEGEFLALMSPSGCKKSTLMNNLGCLDRSSRGRALLEGRDLGSLSDRDLAGIRRDEIGFVFQSFNLIGRISNLMNVEHLFFRQKPGSAPKALWRNAQMSVILLSLAREPGTREIKPQGRGSRERMEKVEMERKPMDLP